MSVPFTVWDEFQHGKRNTKAVAPPGQPFKRSAAGARLFHGEVFSGITHHAFKVTRGHCFACGSCHRLPLVPLAARLRQV